MRLTSCALPLVAALAAPATAFGQWRCARHAPLAASHITPRVTITTACPRPTRDTSAAIQRYFVAALRRNDSRFTPAASVPYPSDTATIDFDLVAQQLDGNIWGGFLDASGMGQERLFRASAGYRFAGWRALVDTLAAAASDFVTRGWTPDSTGCRAAPAGLVRWWEDVATEGEPVYGRFGNLGNEPPLHVSAGDFSVVARVRFWTLSNTPARGGPPMGDMSILDKMDTAGVNRDGWRLLKQSDNQFWFCLGGGAQNQCGKFSYTVFSSTLARVGPWYHLAVVKSRDTITLYVDGTVEDARSPIPPFVDTHVADLYLGQNEREGAYLNGDLQEVGIYNRALSEAEVEQLAGIAAARPAQSRSGDALSCDEFCRAFRGFIAARDDDWRDMRGPALEGHDNPTVLGLPHTICELGDEGGVDESIDCEVDGYARASEAAARARYDLLLTEIRAALPTPWQDVGATAIRDGTRETFRRLDGPNRQFEVTLTILAPWCYINFWMMGPYNDDNR